MEEILNSFVGLLEWVIGVIDSALIYSGVPVNLWTELAAIVVIAVLAIFIITVLSWAIDVIVFATRRRQVREAPQEVAQRRRQRPRVTSRPSRLRRFLAFLGRTASGAERFSGRAIGFYHSTASAIYGKVRSLDEKVHLVLGVAAFIASIVFLGLLAFARDTGMLVMQVIGVLVIAPPVSYVALWVIRAAGWVGARIFPELEDREELAVEVSDSSLEPVGLVTYHEVVDAGRHQVERTGRVFRGFLTDLNTFILLINGRGFLFRDPRRLRQHHAGVDTKKGKMQISYTEMGVFRGLIGEPPSTRFTWRDSMYVLMDFEEAQAVVHGSHSHLRNVSMSPDGNEHVYLWLAEGIEVETEMREGQETEVNVERTGEFLLVEETLETWGGHQGVLAAWAWIGEDLDEEDVEEARAILATIDPDDIVPVPPAQDQAYERNPV